MILNKLINSNNYGVSLVMQEKMRKKWSEDQTHTSLFKIYLKLQEIVYCVISCCEDWSCEPVKIGHVNLFVSIHAFIKWKIISISLHFSKKNVKKAFGKSYKVGKKHMLIYMLRADFLLAVRHWKKY